MRSLTIHAASADSAHAIAAALCKVQATLIEADGDHESS